MESGFYKIEVQANFMENVGTTNLDENGCSVMINGKHGITFATLHRIHIAAKPKKENKGPCSRCIGRKASKVTIMPEPGRLETHEINYCAACGRRLDE